MSSFPQTATSLSVIDQSIVSLQQGASRLVASSLADRIRLVSACIESTYAVSKEWVETAAIAKQIPLSSSLLAEEILGGPVSVLRYLQLARRMLGDLESFGEPRLPGKPSIINGQARVPTFPTRSLYDALVFKSITAETWLQPGVPLNALFGDAPARLTRKLSPPPQVELVLGAGNVAAIPVTDALTMIFQQDRAVLLKMNPVNDYLGSVIEKSLAPLIQAGYLRIIYGGVEQGQYAVNHPAIEYIHITGSSETHDAIVWGLGSEEQQRRKQLGQPLITKPITSELGNVTPWVIVPGEYSESQLSAQAENIAASILNNASFNCIATKVLITWKHWPDRERFLDKISAILARSPDRFAYYPGAAKRFSEFSGGKEVVKTDGTLPWTLRCGVDPDSEPHLFQRESFVCVAAETTIDAGTPLEFLHKSVEFANERIRGTLAIAFTVPDSFRKKHGSELEAALIRLRYGTVGLNQWPGVAYGLMSPPWGGYPSTSLSDVQSGIGCVHNTFLLDRPQKTILRSPLTLFPKPVWFSTNQRAASISWKLSEIYRKPSLLKFAALLCDAIPG